MSDAPTPPASKPAPDASREKWRRMICLGLIALVVFVDRASKLWILNDIKLQEVGRIVVSPIFNLTFTWNKGVSFGALKANSELAKWALIVLSLGIAGVFSVWLWRTQRAVASFGLALVVGGALGNLVDRVKYGAVVDFLDFSALHFPWIFNVADAAITVGAALLALDFLLEAREERAANKSGNAQGLDEERA